jgi:DNA polymerase elongation subunit (family B)
MEELDSSYLRIVKIKNRMFQKDNDILINLFFRNRVICELQLSVHKEENKKERLYSDFNHFIYELKRSEFGIIAEFASIVAQHDPIVNYFTFNQHSPPVIIEGLKKPSSIHLRSRSKELHFRRKFSDGSYLTHKLC